MQTQFLINIYRPTFWSFKYTTCTIEKLHNQLNNYFKKSVIHAYCILMNDELKKMYNYNRLLWSILDSRYFNFSKAIRIYMKITNYFHKNMYSCNIYYNIYIIECNFIITLINIMKYVPRIENILKHFLAQPVIMYFI